METLFGLPARKAIILQDAKRLPGRFLAWISGVRAARQPLFA